MAVVAMIIIGKLLALGTLMARWLPSDLRISKSLYAGHDVGFIVQT